MSEVTTSDDVGQDIVSIKEVEIVEFTDESVGAGNVLWDFGDGNTANGIGGVARNPEHTYAQSGSYNVALTLKNNYGTQTNTETKSSHILIQPSIPIVDFSVKLPVGL